MKFLIKKICTLIMTLFLVSVAAFLAFQVIPGDVVRSILGTEATPEREAQLREELGLDKPPVERYISWADDVLHGDFGVSYRYSKNMNEMMPVKELIGDKLPVTLYLAVISFVMIVLVSIPLGVMWKQVLRCSLWSLDAGHDGGSIIFSWNFSDLPVWHCIKMVCTGRVHKLSGEYDRIFSIFTVPGDFDRFTENSDDCTLFA